MANAFRPEAAHESVTTSEVQNKFFVPIADHSTIITKGDQSHTTAAAFLPPIAITEDERHTRSANDVLPKAVQMPSPYTDEHSPKLLQPIQMPSPYSEA